MDKWGFILKKISLSFLTDFRLVCTFSLFFLPHLLSEMLLFGLPIYDTEMEIKDMCCVLTAIACVKIVGKANEDESKSEIINNHW